MAPFSILFLARRALVGAAGLLACLLAFTTVAHGATVTYYGAAGTFGTMPNGTLADGTTVATHDVPGWGFLPGQAAYFTAVAPDGDVLIANEPQTDNQFWPTARGMALSVYTPSTDSFRNVVIPTSTGATEAVTPNPGVVGGGDVADLQLLPDGQLTFLSAAPYHDWDIAANGEFPTLGRLTDSGAGWQYDAARSRTSTQLAAAGGSCVSGVNGRRQPLGNCHAPAELALLPGSGALAVTHYVAEDGRRHSGDLAVIDQDGRPLAQYALPEIRDADGNLLAVHPREINADPTSPVGDERFVVIYDVERDPNGARTLAPFAAQEFSFDAGARRITPTSLPVLSGGQATDGRTLGFETAQYDSHGRLWLAQAVNGSLTGGPIALYDRTAAGGTLGRDGCTAPAGWAGEGWGTTCAPTATVDAAASTGIVRSLTATRAGDGVIAVTMAGILLPVAVRATGPVALRPVDLGLGSLVDRRTAWIGPRKGAIDPASGDLWVPMQQQVTPAMCPNQPCAPQALAQWLVRVHVADLYASPATPAAVPATKKKTTTKAKRRAAARKQATKTRAKRRARG